MVAEDLDPALQVVGRWLRAVFVDHNTAAALRCTHPHAPLPAADFSSQVRRLHPWLGDQDVEFLEPRPIGPDLDKIDVYHHGEPALRIIVMRRVLPGRDGPEEPLVFTVVIPDGWTGGRLLGRDQSLS